MKPVPPRAPRKPRYFRHHGITRTETHGWLRDTHWQQVIGDPSRLNSDIRAHLIAENCYTEAHLARSEPLRVELFAEMKERLRDRDDSVPLPHGPWAYFIRQIKGGEHPLLCRRRLGKRRARVLLDGNRESQGKSYFKIGCAHHSPDHRHLAWSCDCSGSEEYLLQIWHIEQSVYGKTLGVHIANTDGSCVWSQNGKFLFYVQIDDHHRPSRVFRHRLGSDPTADKLEFEEKNPRFFVSIHSHGQGDFLGISSADHDSSEQYLLSCHDEEATLQKVRPREKNTEYDLYFDTARQRWIIRCNLGDAREFCVMVAEQEEICTPRKWREWLPHQSKRYIEGIHCLKDHIILQAWENALPILCILDSDGHEIRRVRFSEPAYQIAIVEGHEYPEKNLRFFYSSMKTPGKWFDYDPTSGKRRLLKSATPYGNFSPSSYEVRRLEAHAGDGRSIPVSLLYHRDTPLDGSAPLLLYGYGAYGISTQAGFSMPRLSLVDRGFIYAIAHVRGGRERGQAWYLDGKGEKKTNSFTDFLATARFLIKFGYTRRGHIHAWGGSAGGLLVGAALNQDPQLFASVVAEVPFVDVLATMLDSSLPLTPIEWLEWGDPVHNPKDYDRIASYSPVDCVSAQTYPFVLATAGLTDPRVGYWEPAKWVARLREKTLSERPVLLRVEMEAGHGGNAGRLAQLREVADLYGYVIQVSRRKEQKIEIHS